MKKDYSVLLIQLDGNLASDVSTRCSAWSSSGWMTRASHQVESREPNNLSPIQLFDDVGIARNS